MLGHIFENLLEDNKDKGAYYTPKAIVQYMCQQALLHYLRTHLGEHPDLDRLVIEKDPGERTDTRSWVREHAGEIERLIERAKICDPAVGSGAFPIGLLNEMLQIKLALDLTLDPHEAKKTLIQECLHGVDIDPGAIEIARLRFWLSLVVDAKVPEPLPNLDYKLYCADSLIERLRGEPVNIGIRPTSGSQLQTEISKLVEAKRKLYGAQTKPDKRQARHDLYVALGSLAEIELAHLRNDTNFSDEQFGRVVVALKELERLVFDARNLKEKLAKKKGGVSVADLDRALDALQQWFEDPDQPTFLWQLHFGEVFAAAPPLAALDGDLNLGDTLAVNEMGGFDIIIENPPYVRQESIRAIKPLLKEVFASYAGTADLFVYFYERSIELLRPNGVLAIITSNKYYRSAYGAKLRGYLTSNMTLRTLIDFGDAPVFEAIAYASILEASRTVPPPNSSTTVYTWEEGLPLSRVEEVVAKRGQPIRQSKLTADGWRLEGVETNGLRAKIAAGGTPLGKFVGELVFNGVKSGHRKAFTLTDEQRRRLIEEEPQAGPLLRPLLKGRDVKRWETEPSSRWLLYVPWHFPCETDDSIDAASDVAESRFRLTFPKSFAHLAAFRDGLAARDQSEVGIRYEWFCLSRPRSESAPYFDSPKIVFPDIAVSPCFAWDESGSAIENTGYFIPGPKWLLAVLNSSTAFWFFLRVSNRIRGGFVRFIRQYVEQIPIPAASPAEQATLSALVDDIFTAKRSGDGAAVERLEAEIDTHIYRLYRLTDEEIAIVQNSSRSTRPRG
ncbi:MAG: Eco57I restriction-modification methylase domain-containing protein [Blastocatellia bacterium]|nr:Eco57I restriction-modification methylase domain-containing protein [Blastocatellia bacterium]